MTDRATGDGELHTRSIAELASAIAARKLSPVELVEALIARIERLDGQTRAFITPTFALARRQAREAEERIATSGPRGPLDGIPFALEDIYDTRGILTREGDQHMSIRTNRVKQRLASGQVATILSGTNDPDMIDQLGPLGAEGIWLEGEHGGVDYADLGNLTRACDLWGMTSVVRVMDNDYATIYRTLDRGAQGIVVPHVNTRGEAEAVVEAGKFAPLGKRGMFTSRQGFGVGDYLQTANDQSLLIVLIEDIAAVRNLDEVLKVDHIDVFFVAPSDLATSMGHIGNMGHAEVQKTIDGAITKVVQSGRVAGTLVNADNVERYTRLGVRCIMTSFFPWIQAGAKTLMERAAAGARG